MRTGTCDGCQRPGVTPGQCCTYIQLPLARNLTQDEKLWVELHGLKMIGKDVRIEVRCQALTTDGRCSLYGKPERPQMCSDWPDHPDQLPQGCSYAFA